MSLVFKDDRQTTHAKSEDGRFFIHSRFDDDAALTKNKVIRDENIMDKAKLALHENEDVRYAISCPDTVQWSIFKRKHPDIYALIHSKAEHERLRGCRLLQLIHPAWVIFERS